MSKIVVSLKSGSSDKTFFQKLKVYDLGTHLKLVKTILIKDTTLGAKIIKFNKVKYSCDVYSIFVGKEEIKQLLAFFKDPLVIDKVNNWLTK